MLLWPIPSPLVLSNLLLLPPSIKHMASTTVAYSFAACTIVAYNFAAYTIVVNTFAASAIVTCNIVTYSFTSVSIVAYRPILSPPSYRHLYYCHLYFHQLVLLSPTDLYFRRLILFHRREPARSLRREYFKVSSNDSPNAGNKRREDLGKIKCIQMER